VGSFPIIFNGLINQSAFFIKTALTPQRKYLFSWLKSLRHDYLLDEPSPWLTFGSIEFIRSYLKKGMRTFEYGSGGSTLFWLSYGCSCVSIEHDPNWYESMSQRIKTSRKLDYRLIPPDETNPIDSSEVSDPLLYLSDAPCFRGFQFENYVKQIDAFPDNYFDLVLIDGRARPSCVMHCVHKVRQGGLLILDDVLEDRAYYLSKAHFYLDDFDCYEFPGLLPGLSHFGNTVVFIRNQEKVYENSHNK
jgi:hypothetical protein